MKHIRQTHIQQLNIVVDITPLSGRKQVKPELITGHYNRI